MEAAVIVHNLHTNVVAKNVSVVTADRMFH
jgi:hypothetical protein